MKLREISVSCFNLTKMASRLSLGCQEYELQDAFNELSGRVDSARALAQQAASANRSVDLNASIRDLADILPSRPSFYLVFRLVSMGRSLSPLRGSLMNLRTYPSFATGRKQIGLR